MSLLNPAALLWALAALPIIGLYVLKIRQRRVSVSTSLFWRQIFEQKQSRAWWQRLRHLASLLAQLALAGLLVLALAQPYFASEDLRGRRRVLILDHSASMNATDEAPSRLALAKRKAHELIRDLRALDELAIIRAGAQADVVCGFTHQPRPLRQAVDGTLPSDGPTRIAEAVELARSMLAAQGAASQGRIIDVVTDGCFAEAKALTEAGDVRLVLVGRPAANVGITRFQARRSLLDPIGYELLLEVLNASDEPVDCRLDVTLEELPVDSIPLHLQPGEQWRKVLADQRSAEGGRLVARLDHVDHLAYDNAAYALLPRREPRRVNLVSDDSFGNLFVEKVLEASPLLDVRLLDWREGDELPPAALNVFHRLVPGRLPPGPVLLIDPQTSCDLVRVGPPLATPIVAKQENDHPLLGNVKLEALVFPQARQLAFTGTGATLLASGLEGEPLLAAVERNAGRVLVLTARLDPSADLPLRTAFPILVNNALGWFAHERGELEEAMATGDVTHVDLPAAASAGAALRITSPAGQSRLLPGGVQRLALGPLDQVGIWRIGWQRGQEEMNTLREVACNLANRQESDLRAVASPAAQAPVEAAGWLRRPPFLILIAVAWGLFALEWFLYHRRWIT